MVSHSIRSPSPLRARCRCMDTRCCGSGASSSLSSCHVYCLSLTPPTRFSRTTASLYRSPTTCWICRCRFGSATSRLSPSPMAQRSSQRQRTDTYVLELAPLQSSRLFVLESREAIAMSFGHLAIHATQRPTASSSRTGPFCPGGMKRFAKHRIPRAEKRTSVSNLTLLPYSHSTVRCRHFSDTAL